MAGVANTILIEPADGPQSIREKLSGGVITPGHLIERSGATFVVHSSAGLNAQKLFALEDIASAGGIDDDYASGVTTRGLFAQPGNLINALVANGAPAIAIDDALESAGDGTLRKAVTDAATDTTQRDSIVAYATVAVDNSGGSVPVRLAVEVA